LFRSFTKAVKLSVYTIGPQESLFAVGLPDVAVVSRQVVKSSGKLDG